MMQMKVEIDVTDRLAEILRAAIAALGSPIVSVSAAPEQADSPHPEERERRYETPPPPPPAEGKRGRGRPRKDEQPTVEAAAPVEQAKPEPTAAAEGIDPNELWARAKLVAGSGKPHAQAIRDALAVLGVMRLSAIPPEKYPVFGAFLDRLYEGEDIAETLATLTEEAAQ